MFRSGVRHTVATSRVAIAVVAVGIAACGMSTHAARLTAATSSTASSSTNSSEARAPSTSTMATAKRIESGSHEHSITVDGITRTYRTYVPENLSSSKPTPLVIMLHGGFGTAKQAEAGYGWDSRADEEGFIVAFPDGVRRAWNAGTCCGRPVTEQIDDVAFITAVVHAIESNADIDPKRIFVTGMSNGGMMAQRLACESDLFAAYASVAGAQMVACDDPEPISALHIHGAADTNAPMDGSKGNGIGKVPVHTSVDDSIAAWRSVDRCAPPATTVDGTVTTSTSTCADGRAVTFITIAGAGHQWPGSTQKNARFRKLLGMDIPSQALDATSVIWSFFAAHPKGA